MKQAAFFCNGRTFGWEDPISHVYRNGRRERIESLTRLHRATVGQKNFDEQAPALENLEVIFSTWGMPALSPVQLERLPRLEAVFYAAGSVKGFARPFLERGVTVVSAAAANADSVAEFCLGQILLATKGYFHNTRDCRSPDLRRAGPYVGPGTFGETVALLGCGKIARALIRLLAPFRLKILVVDPFLTAEEARSLGVTVVSMEEAFRKAYVVSNHLPNLPDLQRVLDGRLFRSMRSDAVFINTGRGAQVLEDDLVDVLRERPNMLALLDVTDPEPCADDAPWYGLPNVWLSSHIAGAHNDEAARLADLVIEEFVRWEKGEPLLHDVKPEALNVSA